MLALFGAAGLAALVALMVRGGFSTRTEPSAVEAMLARSARSLAMSKSRALMLPAEARQNLASARLHWASHCAGCHGIDGAGDTDMGRNLYPRAPDMRDVETQRLTDGELYATIKNGVRLTGMPAWGSPGDDDLETWELVAFIRTLPALDAEARAEIEKNLPRTPHEQTEDEEEADFLRGATPTPPHPDPEKHP
ncbi:MAG: cytochrome c [Archangium sp.]|nr:cytochrome c [Archangium sp.]